MANVRTLSPMLIALAMTALKIAAGFIAGWVAKTLWQDVRG